MSDALTALQSELAAERAKVAEVQSSLERITGERDAAIAKAQRNFEYGAMRDRESVILESDLAQARKERDDQKEQADALRITAREYEEGLRARMQEVDRLTASLAEMEGRATELQRMLEKATIRLGILRGCMNACESHEREQSHELSIFEATSWIEEQNAALSPSPAKCPQDLEEHFVCPDCGPHTKVDEDGCCAYCGADTTLEPCSPAPPASTPATKGK